MTPGEKKYVACVGLLGLVLVGLVCAGTVFVFSSPDLVRRVSAWRMGASYLGVQGVELQTKPNGCGPASLKMVLDHFDLPVALSEPVKRVALTRRGTSMLALKEAAERQGLCSEGWRLNRQDLFRIPFPAIILIRGDHFVVVDSISPQGSVYVRDPAIGRLRIHLDRVDAMWRGETLVFTRKTNEVAHERKGRTLARESAGSYGYDTKRAIHLPFAHVVQ